MRKEYSFLYAYQGWQPEGFDSSDNVLIFFLIATSLSLLSLLTKKITGLGAFAGGLLTFLLMAAFDWIGLSMITTFFVLGTLTSTWKKNEKRRAHLEQENKGKRDYRNVLANGGVAALVSILAITFSESASLFQLLMTASFAAALSDTVSSELGNVYGKKFINILNLRKAVRGEDGVISGEGSMAGALASAGMAGLYLVFVPDLPGCIIIFFAGIAGNITDSLLGASLQRRGWLNNHTVNFSSIFVATLFALLMYYLLAK